MQPALSPAEAAALLDWYAAMGVDVALDDEPRDNLVPQRKQAPPPPSAAVQAPAIAQGAPAALFVAPPEEAVMAARAAAASAADLDSLKEILGGFEGCALKLTATKLVFGDGNPQARIMLVGEAPGRDEDLDGRPFVGRSGQLLDRMLSAIGLDRSSAYIGNVIPWRPPGNRTPTPQETEICLPFIRRQIELVDPDVLVLLGGAAAQSLLGRTEGILKLRGRPLDYETGKRTVRAMATLHPAYLLRSPLQKRLAWRDLRAIRTMLADG